MQDAGRSLTDVNIGNTLKQGSKRYDANSSSQAKSQDTYDDEEEVKFSAANKDKSIQ